MKMRKLKRFRNLKRIIICNKRNKSNSCPIKLQQLVRKNNRDSLELVNGQRKVDQSRSQSLVLRSHLKSQRRIRRRKRKKIKRKSPKVKARVNQRANQNQRASPNPRKNHRQT